MTILIEFSHLDVGVHFTFSGRVQTLPMQEERERGRIIGLRKRRLETAAWAATFVSLLAEARRELPEYAGRGEPSRQAYADWLNHPHRKVPSRNKKGKWSSETVGRLFDIHFGLIDEAEQEFDIAIAIVRFKWTHAGPEAREALTEEEAAVRQDRARQINDAYRLSADLRGRPYADQQIPPRLQMVSPAHKKRPEAKSEPTEVQLSLF